MTGHGASKEISAMTDKLDRIRKDQKQRIEKEARPGETYAQAAHRLQVAADKQPPTAKSNMRKPPNGDAQMDFFVPALYDVGTRDSRSIMDVAVFRLSKKERRAGDIMRYELPDGYVEVKSGPDGMASIWDYDIVLMLVSQLTEAVNAYRANKGEKPGRTFKPHVSDILRFCRRGHGGKQAEDVESALDRLRGTTIKSVRESVSTNGKKLRVVDAEGLIGGYRVVSYTDSGRVAELEIEIPKWLYREIIDGKRPEVLTVHPDYFLIEPGLGRFIYRLARRAAGRDSAKWSFQTLFERSGSTGTFKKFCFMLRKLIETNDLPEYILSEEKGIKGPQLVMNHRDSIVAIDSSGS
ncbi:MAG: replication initiator protein A [Methylomonas sp.]|nr:replication initiator protein A [Methylomonas sp.]